MKSAFFNVSITFFRQVWWCTPANPATKKAEIQGSEFEASLGKVSKTLSQKNIYKG
jgi:hypothetical protein